MTIDVVVGGQFGSEGKGAVTAWLASRRNSDLVVVRVAGPNAGHTAYDRAGNRWALRQVPVAAVTSDADLYIAPGSEIDPAVLVDEIERLDAAGFNVSARLKISPQATLVEPRHAVAEGGLTNGSTHKGIGAARADRLMRAATLWGDVAQDVAPGIKMSDPIPMYAAHPLIIEGTQGYGLGSHAGYYPFCTSSDCTAIDFLAMAGVPAPWHQNIRVWLVFRPNPIRIAGNSGPLHEETTWEALGLPEEYTTVTQKVRRVGEWDGQLVRNAAMANGGTFLNPALGALTMADHIAPELAGLNGYIGQHELPDRIVQLMYEVGPYVDVRYLGTGPNTALTVNP